MECSLCFPRNPALFLKSLVELPGQTFSKPGPQNRPRNSPASLLECARKSFFVIWTLPRLPEKGLGSLGLAVIPPRFSARYVNSRFLQDCWGARPIEKKMMRFEHSRFPASYQEKIFAYATLGGLFSASFGFAAGQPAEGPSGVWSLRLQVDFVWLQIWEKPSLAVWKASFAKVAGSRSVICSEVIFQGPFSVWTIFLVLLVPLRASGISQVRAFFGSRSWCMLLRLLALSVGCRV